MTPNAPSTDAASAALHHRFNGVCEGLWPALNDRWQRHGPGSLSLDVVASIDSTNTALMQRARGGDTDPALMVALAQTAGRGRMGKAWHSTPGDSLTFSLGLPLSPPQWSGLSLAVGVAVAQGLNTLLGSDAHSPAVRLKWPNDLWLGQAKLAGILVETAHVGGQRYAVVGVGINVRTPQWTAPASPSVAHAPSAQGPINLPPMPPAHLQSLRPALDAAAVLQAVALPLLDSLLTFESHGFEPFRQAFAALDALHGQAVVLSDGVEGVAAGINPTGELRVDTAQGMHTVTSAEVSVRPTSALGQTGGSTC
ncbi:MAG TPA: biotin--[acetyl-CoA-carboxylase] ligase [Burkholderiaceae bacterium]|nr:biotin--[acetyl-CoA-carboxylase] ligase [Burkholderiaceae bacterium]